MCDSSSTTRGHSQISQGLHLVAYFEHTGVGRANCIVHVRTGHARVACWLVIELMIGHPHSSIVGVCLIVRGYFRPSYSPSNNSCWLEGLA